MLTITRAEPEDADAILALQKLAFQSEAKLYDDGSIPPLVQDVESLLQEFSTSVVLKTLVADEIVGSVRAHARAGVCRVGRLIVHPAFQGRGIGTNLLRAIEDCFKGVAAFELFTGTKSEGNIRLYQRHGYAIVRTEQLSPAVSIVFLAKPACERRSGSTGEGS